MKKQSERNNFLKGIATIAIALAAYGSVAGINGNCIQFGNEGSIKTINVTNNVENDDGLKLINDEAVKAKVGEYWQPVYNLHKRYIAAYNKYNDLFFKLQEVLNKLENATDDKAKLGKYSSERINLKADDSIRYNDMIMTEDAFKELTDPNKKLDQSSQDAKTENLFNKYVKLIKKYDDEYGNYSNKLADYEKELKQLKVDRLFW